MSRFYGMGWRRFETPDQRRRRERAEADALVKRKQDEVLAQLAEDERAARAAGVPAEENDDA